MVWFDIQLLAMLANFNNSNITYVMVSGQGTLKKLSSHFVDFGFWMKVLKICEKYLCPVDVKSNYLIK